MKTAFVYIITNKYNSVLYIGVTTNLHQRIIQHKEKKYAKSFSARYNIYKLVYFEEYQYINLAIAREKQIKAGSRVMKCRLVEAVNPDWEELHVAGLR